VGLVEVTDGQLGERHRWLIRPPVFEFSPFDVALHGIGPEMCCDAPTWAESLEQILAVVANRPLVAHNAGLSISAWSAMPASFASLSGRNSSMPAPWWSAGACGRGSRPTAFRSLPRTSRASKDESVARGLSAIDATSRSRWLSATTSAGIPWDPGGGRLPLSRALASTTSG